MLEVILLRVKKVPAFCMSCGLPSMRCRNGNPCFFSHDLDSSTSSCSVSGVFAAEDEDADFSLLLRLFPTSDGCILLLDDIDFYFSSRLAPYYDPFSMIATTSQADSSSSDSSLQGVRLRWGLSHPYQTIISKAGKSSIPWNEVKCVLWFPKFDSDVENWEAQKSLIQTFFQYLAVRILGDALYEGQVIVAMNNIRFAQLQAETWAERVFSSLTNHFRLMNQALES